MTTFVAAAGAIGNTLTIPAHQPGDFLLAAVCRFSSSVSLVPPSDWRSISVGGNSFLRSGLYAKTAQTSAEQFGVFENAELVAVAIYRAATNQIAGLSASYTAGSSSSSFNYLQTAIVGAESWLVFVTCTGLATTDIDVAHPETFRLAVTGASYGGIYIHDTSENRPIGTVATLSVPVSGGPTNYQGRIIQLFDCPGFFSQGSAGFTGIRGTSRRLGT